MALQVWLPLNKDLRNQGLTNIKMTSGTTTTYDNNGIIGKCLTFSGNVNSAIYDNDRSTLLNHTDKFSWAMWVNTNYATTAQGAGAAEYVFTVGRADSGSFGYGMQCTSTSNCNIRFGNQGYNVAVTSGQWTHVAFTKSGTTIKIYRNGELASTNTFNGTLPTYSSSEASGLGLGCFYYGSKQRIYPYFGKIDDVRIYNHVLTADDVKELYWCKLFDLDAYDNFPGVNNLISQPSNDGLIPSTYGWAPEKHVNAIYPNNSWSSGYNSGVGSPASGYHACWKIVENTPTIVFQDMNSTIGQTHRWLGVSNWGMAGKVSPNQKYTISMEARADVDGKQISSGMYYRRTSSESYNFYDGCTTKTLTKEWKRYYWHYTAASTIDSISSVYIYGHYGTEGVSYVRNIQFEIGHVENDFAYTSRPALAYNGNGTDGVFVSNSVVESASTLYFDGTNSYIKTSDLDFMKIVDTGYTISLWINSQEADSSRSTYFGCGDQGNGYTLNLEKAASSNKFRVYNNNSPDWVVDGCVISPNQWIHVVVTRSGGTVTVYKNGVSVGTKTGFSNHSAFDKIYYVGADYRTGDTRYKGYIGDFKIYANPLTAADVSNLYNKEKIRYQ